MAMTLSKVSLKDSSSWYTLLNLIYPVGSIYISYTSTSPGTRFGGTWVAITGRFIYANAGTGTGGSNSHKITINEMPNHHHAILGTYGGVVNSGGAVQDAFLYGAPSISGNYVWTNTMGAYCGGGTSGSGRGANANDTQQDLSNQATQYLPAYQTVYCWRRTA